MLADDATAADQLALSVHETLGPPVFTLDLAALEQPESLPATGLRVLNAATRALPLETARRRMAQLAALWQSADALLPIVQVDSRLRGVGQVLKGLFETLVCDALLFVPAEPELGRLVRQGTAWQVEGDRWKPLNPAAADAGAPANASLRDLLSAELGISPEKIHSVAETVLAGGAQALQQELERLATAKNVIVPNVTSAEQFQRISAAVAEIGTRRILLAGSRTFLRAHLARLAGDQRAVSARSELSEVIDPRRRAAPLAVVASTEATMPEQCAFARRALGPNLVEITFDPLCIRSGEGALAAETARVIGVAHRALRAMRPVLLQVAATPRLEEPHEQQRLLEALAATVANASVSGHVSGLFVAGGQTAETLRRALGTSVLEIRGALETGVPWGVAQRGAATGLPWVTKGGRLGSPRVLAEFFEQAHPWPRSNILPVLTPLTADKRLDAVGLERLLEHLLRLGTTDLFVVGNAGEFRFLSPAGRREALEMFIRAARGRFRIFAGVTGQTADESRRLYEAAAQLGARAAVVMPLYFLESSAEIPDWIESLRDSGANLPLILYNNPERTRGQNIAFEIVEALTFPVVAIKDSSGDPARLARYAENFPVYQGQQRQLWEGWLRGARGAVAIIGHVSALPNEFFALRTAPERREAIARRINELSRQIKQDAPEVAAYKFVLSLAGIIGETVAADEPARQLTPEQRERIRQNTVELVAALRAGSAPRAV